MDRTNATLEHSSCFTKLINAVVSVNYERYKQKKAEKMMRGRSVDAPGVEINAALKKMD